MSDNLPPKIEGAIGIEARPCSGGWEIRWRPRRDLVKRGLPMMTARLWKGREPDAAARAMIADTSRRLQDQMLVWANGDIPKTVMYDGTIAALIANYKSDPDSNYNKKLRWATRRNYDAYFRRLEADAGSKYIGDLDARAIMRLHEAWMVSGVAMAHGCIGMLRTVATFGATLLKCKLCREMKVTLHDMRFEMPKARTTTLTAEHAIAIRAEAHRRGMHSLALAQAFQFECTFRQKDVIGEWVPLSEPGISEIQAGGKKWLRGLRWEEISDDLILRHVTSKRQKAVEIDLHNAPMVMEELKRFGGAMPSRGAVICDERTEDERPWVAQEFRRQWRFIAKAVGVPDSVYNMDTRAGAITEALELGANKEDVRKSATHATQQMTEKYSRGDTKAIASVMQLRAAKRANKTGTSDT